MNPLRPNEGQGPGSITRRLRGHQSEINPSGTRAKADVRPTCNDDPHSFSFLNRPRDRTQTEAIGQGPLHLPSIHEPNTIHSPGVSALVGKERRFPMSHLQVPRNKRAYACSCVCGWAGERAHARERVCVCVCVCGCVHVQSTIEANMCSSSPHIV